jgi:hypothetical protein
VPRAAPPWSAGSHLIGVYLDTNRGPAQTSGLEVRGNVFHRYGDGTPGLTDRSRGVAIVNKGSDSTFLDNLFARVDTPYNPGSKGTGQGTVTGNQGWITDRPLPAEGNVPDRNPGFLDEERGNLANRPDGTIVLEGGAIIPFSSMGIRP